MKEFYVYYLKIEGNNDPFYVGKSFVGSKRFNEHMCDARNYRNKTLKENIIRKAWREGRRIIEEIVSIVSGEEEAHAIEIALIKKWGRRQNGSGVLANHTDGGEGCSGCIMSADARKRMSEKKKGNTINVGRLRPDMKERFSKPVTAFDEEGNFFGSFDSQREASLILDIDYRKISQCLTGRNKTTKDKNGKIYAFRYGLRTEKIEPFAHREHNGLGIIEQCDKDGNVLAEYRNAHEAGRKTKIDSASILRVIRGKNKSAGGYRWRFKEKYDA